MSRVLSKADNFPKDPITGKIIPGPGRPKGLPNRVTGLAKENITEAFEALGGVDTLVKWAKKSQRNLYAFYVIIYPKVIASQAADSVADKISKRPVISRIENVIVDPKDDYRSTVVNGDFSRVADEVAQDVSQAQIGQVAEVASLAGFESDGFLSPRETEDVFPGEIPL